MSWVIVPPLCPKKQPTATWLKPGGYNSFSTLQVHRRLRANWAPLTNHPSPPTRLPPPAPPSPALLCNRYIPVVVIGRRQKIPESKWQRGKRLTWEYLLPLHIYSQQGKKPLRMEWLLKSAAWVRWGDNISPVPFLPYIMFSHVLIRVSDISATY